jgi:hypothetical protein
MLLKSVGDRYRWERDCDDSARMSGVSDWAQLRVWLGYLNEMYVVVNRTSIP